jgi:hypothetical protein
MSDGRREREKGRRDMNRRHERGNMHEDEAILKANECDCRKL